MDYKSVSVKYVKIGTLLGGFSYLGYKMYQKRFYILALFRRFTFNQKMVEYKGYNFDGDLYKCALKLEDFTARPDDIYVCTFPKSGTTWVQEIVYLVQNECNFDKAKSLNLESRFPFLEMQTFFNALPIIDKAPSPRLLKTHLPYEVLPEDIRKKQCKIIYCSRNPKDVSVSLFFFLQFLVFAPFGGTFEDFAEKFMSDQVPYAPYWKHNLTFWKMREENHILFIKYEDLQKDSLKVVREISKFLNQPLSESQLAQIVKHCSFSSMKTNDKTNYKWMVDQGLAQENKSTFMRKGVVGDWRNHYTIAMSDKMDEKYREMFNGTGLSHDF